MWRGLALVCLLSCWPLLANGQARTDVASTQQFTWGFEHAEALDVDCCIDNRQNGANTPCFSFEKTAAPVVGATEVYEFYCSYTPDLYDDDAAGAATIDLVLHWIDHAATMDTSRACNIGDGDVNNSAPNPSAASALIDLRLVSDGTDGNTLRTEIVEATGLPIAIPFGAGVDSGIFVLQVEASDAVASTGDVNARCVLSVR